MEGEERERDGESKRGDDEWATYYKEEMMGGETEGKNKWERNGK